MTCRDDRTRRTLSSSVTLLAVIPSCSIFRSSSLNFHPKEGLKQRESRAVEASVARIPGSVLHETDPVCPLRVTVWRKAFATRMFPGVVGSPAGH